MSKSKIRNGTKRKVPAAIKPYVPTSAECKSVGEFLDRLKRAKPHANAKVAKEGDRTLLSWDHPMQEVAAALWANALGATDLLFGGTLLEQLAQISRTGTDL